MTRGAYEEAIAQLSRGLERVPALPDGAEREQQGLLLQLALGPAWTTTKGWTAREVEKAHGRAAELCTRGGGGPQLWQALYGLWLFYVVRADLQRTGALAEQLLQSARPSGDAATFCEARATALAGACSHRGAVRRPCYAATDAAFGVSPRPVEVQFGSEARYEKQID